ncbi:gamma-glutamyltransferase [Aurantimonas sp. C2-6-R+9]|uniref:gamma-glutamyltransferase family protein n=1 Tax=unclassified Aurantimonas TaxID=2638230 RepID=UPI002E1917B3|nr:gamma-glutamyltransferase [Aurantimonas sp. C2-6-R+9]
MSIDSVSQSGPAAESTFKAGRAVIAARSHAVSTGHYLATQAAFQILENGGNAVDAGIAACLVLGVVHSDQVNIAGVSPMMIWMADREELMTIDGVGHWPAAANCEYFIREFGGAIPEGLLRTVIPAAPAACLTALSDYGTMSFCDVSSFAIRFARDGFVMYPFLAEQLAMVADKIRRWDSNSAIYLPGGKSPNVGDLFIQSDLGASLQYIADEERAAISRGDDRQQGLRAARDAFYRGDIMRSIVNFHRENGGLMTEGDFANYEVKKEPALCTKMGDMDVYSCGFWCQGPTLLQAINITNGIDLARMGHNTTEYIHHVAESIKLALADREEYYGDPDFIKIPSDMLLSQAYADERRSLIDSNRAWPGLPPAGGEGAPRQSIPAAPHELEQTGPFDTSYVGVVDRDGNAISICPSDVCSDTIVIPGTGLAPSSRGSQSRAIAGHPASVAPGKRPRLTPNPAMVVTPGKIVMPIGSPGGDSQIQAVLQVLLNMQIFAMDPQSAIEAPRFITNSQPDSFAPHVAFPRRICIEGRIPPATLQGLSEIGHEVVVWPDRLWRAGGVCLVRSDLESGTLEAGADPRRAAAYAQGW